MASANFWGADLDDFSPAHLATPPDSRPPTAHAEAMGDPEDDQQEDLALMSYADAPGAGPTPDELAAIEAAEGLMMYMQAAAPAGGIMSQFHPQSSTYTGVHFLDAMLDQHIDALDSLTMEPIPSLVNTSSGPTIQEFLAHGSVSDLDIDWSVNPNEEYLNHLNKDRFLSISAFFRHFVGYKDSVASLDVFPAPDLITRDDLRGDECDMQGIDWASRKTTRAAVRAKRTIFESARLSPQLVALRQVYQIVACLCITSLISTEHGSDARH